MEFRAEIVVLRPILHPRPNEIFAADSGPSGITFNQTSFPIKTSFPMYTCCAAWREISALHSTEAPWPIEMNG
jgi:hypothetical protein